MEFSEKLQELRKSKGLTQEELAEILYVSRTAVSKWESGRGYPNIDSLKEISKFFSVSIDNLLSGEKILSIAENESKTNVRKTCTLLFGIVDLFAIVLFILPLYPNRVNDFVFSVNMFNYTQVSQVNKCIYCFIFVSLFVAGIVNLIFIKAGNCKNNEIIMKISIAINVLSVLFLAITSEVYAVVVVFFLLIIKGVIYCKNLSFVI